MQGTVFHQTQELYLSQLVTHCVRCESYVFVNFGAAFDDIFEMFTTQYFHMNSISEEKKTYLHHFAKDLHFEMCLCATFSQYRFQLTFSLSFFCQMDLNSASRNIALFFLSNKSLSFLL